MKHLAVFDWNGTLFDDVQASLEGANAVFEFLGRQPLSIGQYRQTFTFPILHFYTANGISPSEYLECHDEAARIYLETYENAALQCRLRTDATELLEWLNANGIKCMLLSNHLLENVEKQLARFHIHHFFSHISCNSVYDASFIQKMNKHDRLQSLMRSENYPAATCFIIGDSLEEPEIAGKLGLSSFCIAGGYLSRDRLLASGTDHVVDNFTEVINKICTMWKLDYKKAS